MNSFREDWADFWSRGRTSDRGFLLLLPSSRTGRPFLLGTFPTIPLCNLIDTWFRFTRKKNARMKLGPTKPESLDLGDMTATFGDQDPISNGGGRVFCTSHGTYFEYTDGQDYDEGVKYVFGTSLERDVFDQFCHLFNSNQTLEDLCGAYGYSREQWLLLAKGTVHQRASCVVDLAYFFEWRDIDDDPLLLTSAELLKRWYGEFKEEGPIVNDSAEIPTLFVQLFIVLQCISKPKFWELFPPLFPLVPDVALQNTQHPWWKQHGKAALQKLLTAMRDVCPPSHVFEIRNHEYGYWPKGC